MKKKCNLDKIPIINLLCELEDKKRDYLSNIIQEYPIEWSYSKILSRTKRYFNIIKNNDYSILKEIIKEYDETSSVERKLEILYGYNSVNLNQYLKKMKSRPRPKHAMTWKKEYWMYWMGYDENSAIIAAEKVSDRAKNSYRTSSKKHRPKSIDFKHSVDYWTYRGYSLEESLILREPFLRRNDLNSFIDRHGEVEGTVKYEQRIQKYKKTSNERIHLRRTAGYVSLESIKFFIPLYKFCRKIGIPKNKIYFGIKGSREFFIRDNTFQENRGSFYDFVITHGINVAIEYNGTFWHARNEESWNNPFVDYKTSKKSDEYKKELCEKFGMEYYIVWSDDNKSERLEFLKNIIQKRVENAK